MLAAGETLPASATRLRAGRHRPALVALHGRDRRRTSPTSPRSSPRLNTALTGNAGDVRRLLARLDVAVTDLNADLPRVDRLTASLDRLTKRLAGDLPEITRSLTDLTALVTSFDVQRADLVLAMESLNRFDAVATPLTAAVRRDLVAQAEGHEAGAHHAAAWTGRHRRRDEGADRLRERQRQGRTRRLRELRPDLRARPRCPARHGGTMTDAELHSSARRWRRRSHLAQTLILVILVAGVLYVADTVVGGSLFRNPYHLTVELPQAAGLHEGSVVTYRGQRIGEVTEVRLGDSPGVGAVAEPGDRFRRRDPHRQRDGGAQPVGGRRAVPRRATAHRRGSLPRRRRPGSGRGHERARERARGARPRRGPDGAPRRRRHPHHRDRDAGDLRRRRGRRGPACARHRDGDRLRAAAPARARPDHAGAARGAAAGHRRGALPEIRRMSADLEAIARSLAAATPSVRRTVVSSLDLLPRLERWWQQASPELRRMLRSGVPLTEMAARHLRGLQHWLDWAPAQADVMAGSTRGGSGRVVLVPRILKNCVYDRSVQRDVQDTTRRAPVTGVRCTDPPPGTQGRGSTNVPRQ
ncbi:MCE family protein [Nocardioides sp. W3-2-3]|uniref:MlaD family protein n=1 Tax=Nocardioides convexus TaxID=2712224 RepID=UPI0024185D43|nr:MlaD family protein [Nocardioides convexus]NHA01783.1 MCE family protein [Nocardioides convexus]